MQNIEIMASCCTDKPWCMLEDMYIQGGSNMTGTDLCVNKSHCAAAVRP